MMQVVSNHRPIIGVTVDNRDNAADSGQYESSRAYSLAVAAAGGLPMLLPHDPELAADYVQRCDGLVLTGGADPVMEGFGETTHRQANRMDSRRQAFELALLAAAEGRPELPVLGICLGMQLMALHAGGRLNQYLPDTLAEPELHQKDNLHTLTLLRTDSVLCEGMDAAGPCLFDSGGGGRLAAAGGFGGDCGGDRGGNRGVGLLQGDGDPPRVVSWHRQAVSDGGGLRVVATASDGVIEAIDDPTRRFYLGVQWHPERGAKAGLSDENPFNQRLFGRLAGAAREAMACGGWEAATV